MPCVRAKLIYQGETVSRKRVARLMRLAGIRGISRRRGFTVTTGATSAKARRPILRDAASLQRPNELWVVDIAYVPTWAAFIYLVEVLDGWSGARNRPRERGKSNSTFVELRIELLAGRQPLGA